MQAEEHHPNCEARGWQRHVVGVLCCRRDWCTSQNRWHHEGGKLYGYIEATSQDIRQEVKALSHMGLQNGQLPPSILPKLWQNGLRTTKARYWSGHHESLTSILYNIWGRTEKACASKEAYKPDSVTPALSGGMGQNSPKLLWVSFGRLLETFDPS